MKLRNVQAMAPFMMPTSSHPWGKTRRVTVDADSRLTREQAVALLELGQGSYAVLRVGFGPRNGWKDMSIAHTVRELNRLRGAYDGYSYGYFMVRKIEEVMPPLYRAYYKD